GVEPRVERSPRSATRGDWPRSEVSLPDNTDQESNNKLPQRGTFTRDRPPVPGRRGRNRGRLRAPPSSFKLPKRPYSGNCQAGAPPDSGRHATGGEPSGHLCFSSRELLFRLPLQVGEQFLEALPRPQRLEVGVLSHVGRVLVAPRDGPLRLRS